MTTADITIYGPNLRSECGPCTFHVHKRGCQHGRLPKYRGAETLDMTAATRMDIVRTMYCDQIEESGDSAKDYAYDFHFAPCVDGLPEGE